MLRDTVASLRAQRFRGTVEIAVCDDGSAWAEGLLPAGRDHVVLDRAALRAEPRTADLDVDILVAGARTDSFRKAILWNIAARATTADALVFFDDDHRLARRGDLARFARYLDRYEFVAGRIQEKSGAFRRYDDPKVQGTTIAMRRDLFDRIGGFGEYTSEWGHGVDTDLYWRVYCELGEAPRGRRRAVYAGEILTRNAPGSRRKRLASEEAYCAGFLQRHGVHPRENPSRNKTAWFDHSMPAFRVVEASLRAVNSALELRTKLRWVAQRIVTGRV